MHKKLLPSRFGALTNGVKLPLLKPYSILHIYKELWKIFTSPAITEHIEKSQETNFLLGLESEGFETTFFSLSMSERHRCR